MAGGSTSRAAQSAPHSSARSLSGQHRSVYAAESLRVLPGRAAAGTATQHATGAAAAAHHAQHTPRPTAPPSRPPPPRGTSVELSHVVEHGGRDAGFRAVVRGLGVRRGKRVTGEYKQWLEKEMSKYKSK